MPNPTPLEEARDELFNRIGEFIEDGLWLSQSAGIPPKVDALIAAAQAEAVEPLREALRPFAEFAEWFDGVGGWQYELDDRVLCRWATRRGLVNDTTSVLKVGTVREARHALSTSEASDA